MPTPCRSSSCGRQSHASELLEPRRLLSAAPNTGYPLEIVANVSATKLARAGSTLFLRVKTPAHGDELWASDGTGTGTRLIKDIRPGPEGSRLTGFTPMGDTLFFFADDGTHGAELWKSDGTAEGTVIVAEIAPGTNSAVDLSRPVIAAIGDRVYFGADTAAPGVMPYVSDGTAGGTRLIASLAYNDATPKAFFEYNGAVHFLSGSSSTVLFRVDGAASGATRLVGPLFPGPSSNPVATAVVDGRLFFTANQSIWASDGTPAGTVKVADWIGSHPYVLIHNLTAFDGKLFFLGTQAATGTELWRSDGTVAGTHPVIDLNPGPANGVIYAAPETMTVFNDRLLFRGDNGVTGAELWSTDGTPEGTTLVRDLLPGNWGFGPQSFTLHDGVLYYSSVSSGLARTDGTAAGTVLLPATPEGQSNAVRFHDQKVLIDDSLFFLTSGVVGGASALYRWTFRDTTPPAVLASRLSPGFRSGSRIEFDLSEDVAASLAPEDFVLTNLDNGQVAPPSHLRTFTEGFRVFVEFPGFAHGLPPDGNYRLAIRDGGLSDLEGNALTGAPAHDFFVLAGDANRDRQIGANDYSLLQLDFNRPVSSTSRELDFNHDRRIDFEDWALFAPKFGRTLPPPGVSLGREGAAAQASPTTPAAMFSPVPVRRDVLDGPADLA